MRKAVEYLEGLFEEPYNLDGNSIESDFLNIIKQAQLEAIEETVKLCAEKADLEYAAYEWEIPEGVIMTGDNEYGYTYINKDSILNCAEILKKGIE